MKGRLEAQSASFAGLFFTFFAGGEEEGMFSQAPMEARYPSALARRASHLAFEVFGARLSDEEEMIRLKLEERSWARGGGGRRGSTDESDSKHGQCNRLSEKLWRGACKAAVTDKI